MLSVMYKMVQSVTTKGSLAKWEPTEPELVKVYEYISGNKDFPKEIYWYSPLREDCRVAYKSAEGKELLLQDLVVPLFPTDFLSSSLSLSSVGLELLPAVSH